MWDPLKENEIDENQTGRPAKIGTAVNLLYISSGIGVLRHIIQASRHAPKLSPASLIMPIGIFNRHRLSAKF
jgi:hypothetical protein